MKYKGRKPKLNKKQKPIFDTKDEFYINDKEYDSDQIDFIDCAYYKKEIEEINQQLK